MKAIRLINVFLLSFSLATSGQNYSSQKFGRQLIVLTRFLELNHYSPRIIDDSLSAEVFDEVIKKLDPDRMHFFQSDMDELMAYRYQVDEEMSGKKTGFADALIRILKMRLNQSDSLVQSILQKPFDYTIDESISFSRDSLRYAANKNQWVIHWNKWLKYRSLVTMLGLKEQATSHGTTTNTPDFDSEARKRVLVKETGAIRRISQNEDGFENYIGTVYCNAIASRFDPHTEYMPAKARREFEEELNGVELSVGIRIDENEKGEIIISQLVPGGPAWRSGELHKGDALIKIEFEGKDPIDLSGMDIDDANAVIQGTNDRRMSLTVRQMNGVNKTVQLLKEEVKDDENFVRSFVLNGTKKIGYISLPGFYSPEESELGSSCANDVAKEIVKLKKENIQGLILDLRFNGGGSLKEALDMAGIFINEGPLVVVKNRSGKASVIRDMNRGSIYDGPLLLMVNSMSASASELVSSVLQDYQRALISGSNTYGKGTAQAIFPLDTLSELGASQEKNPEFGFIKITMRKFYRVNGGTVQFAGVKPDIVLPDIYDAYKFRESSQSSALKPDSISKTNFPILPAIPFADLSVSSQKRVGASASFQKMIEVRDWLKKDLNNRVFNLNLEKFQKQYDERTRHFAETDVKLPAGKKDFVAENNAFDKQRLATSSERSQINSIYLKNLGEDVYLNEAFHVISDMVSIQSH